MRLVALLMSLSLLAAGCASVTQKPEVSLAGVELEEIGLLEQRFGLRLRVMNPNGVDIPIDGLACELEVNGQPFAKGVSNRALVVPRYGEAVLEVSAVSNLGGLLRQLRDLQKGGRDAVSYRLNGRLNSGALTGVPFTSSGEIALPALGGPRRGPATDL